MFHLGNGLIDVRQCLVLAVLLYPVGHFRLPALRQLFQRTHVQIAVVEIIFQLRHPAREKTAVLADRVAAHRRGANRHMLFEKLDHLRFHHRIVERRSPDLVDQAGLAVAARAAAQAAASRKASGNFFFGMCRNEV